MSTPINWDTRTSSDAEFTTFKISHENKATCWAGSGWLSAQWIKLTSSKESIADKLYEKLQTNSLDGETLRWFSSTELKGLFDKIQILGTTPNMSVVFDNAATFAITRHHREKKQVDLWKLTLVAGSIPKAPPPPPITGRVSTGPQTRRPTSAKSEPVAAPLDMEAVMKKALAMKKAREENQPRVQSEAQAKVSASKVKFAHPENRYGQAVINKKTLDEARKALIEGKIISASELNKEILNNLNGKMPSLSLVTNLASMLTSCEKDDQAKKVFASFPLMQQLWLFEQVGSKHKERFMDYLAENIKSAGQDLSANEVKDYVKMHRSTKHTFTERYRDLFQKLSK